jgi:hypothetical protein
LKISPSVNLFRPRRLFGKNFVLACVGCFWTGALLAQSPVALKIDAQSPGVKIPADFSGLSFEISNLLPGADGKRLFSPDNRRLITLFRTLGIKSLRVGGNTADLPKIPIPNPADIDSLFAFARAAGVKVIYTVRLRNGNIQQDAAIVRYIEQHYRSQLTCFAIGNEPDFYRKVYPVIKTYPEYRAEWKKYAAAIAAAAPGAKFCGPSAGETTSWSRDFANDFGRSGWVTLITQHDYPGGGARDVASAASARNRMLSPAWLQHYQEFYEAFATTALSNGLPYRFEEANNFTGGAKNASDTFAAALWALDFMHWWAAHGCAGVNFHNRRWILSCVIHPAVAPLLPPRLKTLASRFDTRRYAIYPIGYGIKAFDLGGHGRVTPVTISNPDKLNLTAYAVRGARNFFVTIINKEHGANARAANVTIAANRVSRNAAAIFLTAPNGCVAAKTGVTLGGASICADRPWRGKWTPLPVDPKNGPLKLKVPAASAAVVRFLLND